MFQPVIIRINSLYHLLENDVTYYEHFKRAIHFSYVLFRGSILTLIHAIYPNVYTTATTETVEYLSSVLPKHFVTKIPGTQKV